MITGYDNGEQISKYLHAVIQICLVRQNSSGECEPQWLDGKQIRRVNTAPTDLL